MDLELRHLRIVVALADSGSITRVAARLGVSQPAMSAQVKRIERIFGGRLFERGRAGVVPTALGESIVERCRAVVGEVDALLATATRQHVDRDVALVVGTNTTSRFTLLLEHLVRLGHHQDVLPHVEVSTAVLDTLLLDGAVDLALVGVHPGFGDACPEPLEELVVVEREPLLIALSAEHPLAVRREVDLRDLAGEAWLLPPGRPDGTDAALRAAWLGAGIEPATPYGRQEIATFWPYIASGRAVALALPSLDPPPGAVLRPLRDQPVWAREVVRWNPRRVAPDVAEVYADAAAAAFGDLVARRAHHQPWWHESPEHRPVVRATADGTRDVTTGGAPMRSRAGGGRG